MVDLVRNSKADTLFYGDVAYTDIFGDSSQYQDSLDDNGTWISKSVSDLRFQKEIREFMCLVQLTTSDSGIILYLGDDSNTDFNRKMSIATGVISFYIDSSGTPITSLAPPNLSGSERRYVIQWCMMPDPIGGNYLSEICCCDLTTGSWTIARANHAQPVDFDADFSISAAATGSGGSAFSGGINDFEIIRFGTRFHSTQEAKEDWVSESSAPSTDGLYLPPEVCPKLEDFYDDTNTEDVAVAIANDYSFAGPALFLGSQQSFRNRIRGYCSLVNQINLNPVTLDNTYSPSSRFLFVSSPNGYDGYININYLYYRPKPSGSLIAQTRIFAKTWLAAGAPVGSTVSIDLFVGLWDYINKNKITWISTPVTSTTNHGSGGLGEWFDLGTVQSQGFHVIGYKVNAVTGASYNRLQIKAVNIQPLAEEDWT